MKKERRHFSPKEKVAIIRKHLIEKVPVSDLCDEYKLHPNVFFRWQKEFFDNGAAAFEKETNHQQVKFEKQIFYLERKLQRKHEVLSELMEEHIQLKKARGEL